MSNDPKPTNTFSDCVQSCIDKHPEVMSLFHSEVCKLYRTDNTIDLSDLMQDAQYERELTRSPVNTHVRHDLTLLRLIRSFNPRSLVSAPLLQTKDRGLVILADVTYIGGEYAEPSGTYKECDKVPDSFKSDHCSTTYSVRVHLYGIAPVDSEVVGQYELTPSSLTRIIELVRQRSQFSLVSAVETGNVADWIKTDGIDEPRVRLVFGEDGDFLGVVPYDQPI